MRSNVCSYLHYYFLKLPEFCTLLEFSMLSTVMRPYKRRCVSTGFAYGGHYALADIGSRNTSCTCPKRCLFKRISWERPIQSIMSVHNIICSFFFLIPSEIISTDITYLAEPKLFNATTCVARQCWTERQRQYRRLFVAQ